MVEVSLISGSSVKKGEMLSSKIKPFKEVPQAYTSRLTRVYYKITVFLYSLRSLLSCFIRKKEVQRKKNHNFSLSG